MAQLALGGAGGRGRRWFTAVVQLASDGAGGHGRRWFTAAAQVVAVVNRCRRWLGRRTKKGGRSNRGLISKRFEDGRFFLQI